MEQGGDGIEESSVRLGGGGSDSRWVDGSEVDSESLPPWSQFDADERGMGEEVGGLRRRLSKKPRRVDSFDVEAMDIADSPSHRSKVSLSFFLDLFYGMK